MDLLFSSRYVLLQTLPDNSGCQSACVQQLRSGGRSGPVSPQSGTCSQLLSRAPAQHAALCLMALLALQVGYGWYKACCMNCDNCVVGKDVSQTPNLACILRLEAWRPYSRLC